MLLDQRRIDQALAAGSELPRGPAPSEGRECRSLECPADRSQLAATRYRGVEIDICRHCQGIWLDAGELERILKLKGYGLGVAVVDVGLAVPSDSGLFAAGGELAAEAAQAVLEFLGDAVSGL